MFDAVTEAVIDWLADELDEPVELGVVVRLPVVLAVPVELDDCVVVCDAVLDRVLLSLGVWEMVIEGLVDCDGVCDTLGVPLGVGVPLVLGDALMLEDELELGVLDSLCDCVCEIVREGVWLRVRVLVCVLEGVCVRDRDRVPV